MPSSIMSLHQDFVTGRQDPILWLEELEDRILRVQETTNAFIHLDIGRARKSAEESRQRYREGRFLSVLDGIFVGLKDLFETANMPTTAGSKILRDYQPTEDAMIVQKLRQWGANCDLGKLNLHEFAFGPTSASSFFGPVHHPLDFTKMAGGSSGGSAAVVAEGVMPLALGTDTGGSIRIPAAFCGVIGLKPTYERLSRQGVIPLSWTLDHVGAMTRTLDDLAVFMDLLFPKERYKEQMAVTPHALKIFVPEGSEGTALDSDLQQQFTQALGVLSGLRNVDIKYAPLPEIERIRAAQLVIIGSEAANYHWQWLQERPWDYQNDVRERLSARSSYLAVQYIEGLRSRRELIDQYRTFFDAYDVIILPTVPLYPPELDVQESTGYEGQKTDIRNLLVWMTAPFNLLGLPALTLPVGQNSKGFAASAQIVASWGQEGRLLQVAKMWQDAINA